MQAGNHVTILQSQAADRKGAMERETAPPNGRHSAWKLLGIVSAVAVGIVAVIDAFTRTIGVVAAVTDWVGGPPTPIVVLKPIQIGGGRGCLEFAFSNLPKTFILDEIHLHIIRATGPTAISGDMSARPYERIVNMELSPSILSGDTKTIEFRVPVEAKKRNDIAYIDFCPVLTVPGQSGQLYVAPSLYAPDSSLIEDIKIVTHDKSPVAQGVKVDLSRPKNAVISVDETRFRLVPR